MKHISKVLIAIAVVFGMTMQYAEADNPWKGRISGLRSSGGSNLLRSGANRVLQNSGRSFKIPTASGAIRGGSSRSGLAQGLGSLATRGRVTEGLGRSGSPNLDTFGKMLGAFGNYAGHGYGYDDRDRYENEMADAYRDAAIANAVVGLVGIMVSAAQQPQYNTVAALPVSAAPMPVTVAPPPGRWERQTVVVQPAHYETYQEWIPEIYDSRTGQQIGGGYHESRSRLVPETYQYRDVWVTP
jgi:hypothetical protein